MYPKLFPNSFIGFPGDFPRPVGNANAQILAKCRLGNQNSKSLLHAGWEIQTPNPCYMQAGKPKPQIFATCRLGNSNLNPCYMQVGKSKLQILATCGLGNQNPNPCYMRAGNFKFKHLILVTCRLRVQNPHTLATRRLGNQTTPPTQSLATCR